MATSWEVYKKKREQGEEDIAPVKKSSKVTLDVSEDDDSSWRSYSASRAADKLVTNSNPLSTVVKQQQESEERKWFESGAFSDGYQFGDLTKTILGTGVDVYEDVAKGILGIGEGVIDTGAYLLGGGAKLIGQEEFAETTKDFIKRDLVEESGIARRIANTGNPIGWVNSIVNGNVVDNFNFTDFKKMADSQANDEFEANSALGDKSDSLVESGGQLLGTVGLQAVGVPWWVTTGTTSFGSGTEEAFNNDATYGEAGVYGLVSAGAEILTEKISGGISFGGKTLDAGLKEALTKNISNKTLQTLGKFGLDATGEGMEEVFSQVIQNVGQKLTYADEKTWQEILASEEAMDAYLESFIGGAVLGGGSSVVNTVSERSEIAPVDNTAQIQGLQEAIAAKQQELTQVQDVREQQIIQEEIEVLNQELTEATNAQQFTSEDLKQQQFTYKVAENDSEYKQAVYESASKYMNDTKEAHDFVDTVAKIAEDRQTRYEFVNTEAIKEAGYDIENVSVNGLVTEDGRILVNIDSNQGLDFIVGHETTHLLEGTQEYQALQDLVVEYAKSKGIYEDRAAKLHSLYKDTNANIDNELTSDLVGELLFTDQAFIENLSVKQPTLFEKIKNFISDLIVKVKGTAQEKQLRQLQRSFEKAYKAQGTQTNTDTKYSLYNEDKALYDYKGDIKAEGQGFTKSDKKMQALLEKNDINAIDNQKEFIRTAIDRESRLGNELWAERLRDAYNRSKKEREHTIKQYLEKYKNENSNVKYSLTDNQGRTLTKEQQEKYKYSKIRDENGNLKVMYHGTQRADRVGTVFDPNRATSGPMAFFTDSQDIAQNYSTNKSDTSLSREYDTEYDLFKADGKDLDTYWNSLSKIEQQKINKEGNNVGFDDDWEGIVYGESASENSFSDMYKWYLNNETQGNGIKALYNVWVQDGNIMGDDLYKFQEVLEKAGIKNVEFLDPYKVDSKVYEVYLNVTNPFDTSNMSEDIINQFKEAAKTATIGEQYSADAWDKSNIAPEDWISKLESDIAEGTTHAWTVIPDWVTNVLKANGYDGIVDTGGKNGGAEHQVVIPFYSEQIKNITNENPTDNSDINMSLTAQEEAPIGNIFGADLKLQVEEAIAPLQETIKTLTEQVQAIQENIAPVVEEVKPEQVIQSTKPTLEEVKNLMDIRDNKSGSEYASAFFALRDKYGQVNLYKSLNEYYATGTVTDEDITTPTSQDIVEQQGQEAFENITDNDAPIDIENRSFEDIADEIIWNEGFEGTTEVKVESPFDNRDIDEVGNRKVKAYQYENPEVRPYFQAEAENMMWDLNNTIKGERTFNDQLYYDSNGEKGFFGVTRQTTEAIAYLKDKYGYSYAQIEKGLNDIIEDNGKENNAVAKRIEFMLDERLREGYTTSDGTPIPPNEEYINFLAEKQITEYNKEAFNALTDTDIPIADDILNELDTKVDEAIKSYKTEQTIAPDVQESTTGQLELKVDESIAPTENEAQNRNTELSDTSVETQEQEKVAQILSEAPTQQNKKQRLWAKVRAAIFDKGSVFEDLSIKTKNREIMAKWDNTLLAEAVAQDVMLNGTREIDAKSKTSNQLSKSLVDIKAEVENSGKVQEFSEYLYHKHNISRMSLEANAQARMAELQETTLKGYDVEAIEKLSRKRIPNKVDKKSEQLQFKDVAKQAEVEINAAKEYMRLSEAKNKPVFGESVTAEVSQGIVDEFEMNNPEFIDWANDVYDYNKANLNHLVNNGVISQETADQFAEMYPNYVPIGRAKNLGSAINVPLFSERTGVNNPIKRATGGDSDILPLFDTMARRTIQTYRAAAKNDFGVELKNTLNSVVDNQTTDVDEILDNVDQQENLLQEGKNGQAPTFTVFENGEKVTYEITQDMYDALKPVSDSSILSTTFKPFNKISNFHRGVLTEYNPVFMLTNSIKDAQDILLNSQHATKTYAKLPESYVQILSKGYWYQEYMANGGQQNSYFDSQEGNFDTEAKGVGKLLELPPLKQISQLNNVIELAPRLAEYIASRESGRSKKVAMLDAARVTTNFKAGGDVTKWANRNGATFLNASIQGAMQQVRNVREAHANGLKGYANLAAKFTLASVPAMILNSLLWDDDEDYQELSDYVKQNYWIVGKYGDGNFIRIPKGRMITVVQEGLNQMTNLVTGNDEADLGQFLEIVGNNIAPNNPVENNVLAPIIQAATNKTWYGGDLVPTRLQDVPTEEQYDESIDKLSIAIGQATGISPYKINYVLDQYSGGIGDVFLPMMTEQAEGGNDSLGSKLLAPLTSKFSVDSTMKNQNVNDLYTLSEEITTKANSSKATDTDILQNKYLNAIKTEMNELYKEKREIQNSNLPDSQKYNQVREIQKQINDMAQKGLEEYGNVSISSSYASVSDKEYYNKNGTWTKVNEDESTDLNSLGMTTRQKEEYFNLKNSISTIDKSESENKKPEIATAVMNANLTDEQKAYIYGKSYSSDETLNMVVNGGIDFNEYLKYAAQTITADKDSDGKSISGTRKTKVIKAINSLNLDIPQKAMLIRKEYSSFREYNNDIVRYVNGLDIDYQTKVDILSELEFTVSADGTVSWK